MLPGRTRTVNSLIFFKKSLKKVIIFYIFFAKESSNMAFLGQRF